MISLYWRKKTHPAELWFSFLKKSVLIEFFLENLWFFWRKYIFPSKKNNQMGKSNWWIYSFQICWGFRDIPFDEDARYCSHGTPKVTHCLKPSALWLSIVWKNTGVFKKKKKAVFYWKKAVGRRLDSYATPTTMGPGAAVKLAQQVAPDTNLQKDHRRGFMAEQEGCAKKIDTQKISPPQKRTETLGGNRENSFVWKHVPSLATNPPPSHKDRPNKTPAKVHVVQKKGKKQQPKEEWCKRIPQKNRQNPPPTIYLHHKRCPHGVRGVRGWPPQSQKKARKGRAPQKYEKKDPWGGRVQLQGMRFYLHLFNIWTVGVEMDTVSPFTQGMCSKYFKLERHL